MNNKLKINLSGARFNNFKSVFDSLEKCLNEVGIGCPGQGHAVQY